MKKLRLLVTEKCNRHCEGCCNKDIKPSKVISASDCWVYDEIMITGGEPMLFQNNLYHLLREIAPDNLFVYLYTATFTKDEGHLAGIFDMLGGITFTIHDQRGMEDFIKLQWFLTTIARVPHSKRLNIFRGIELPVINLYGWDVKFIDWIKNCPIPEDEDFCRLENLW